MTNGQNGNKGFISRSEIVIGVLGAVITITLCVLAIVFRNELAKYFDVARYGLLGILVIAFVAASSFSITAIPVPYWVVTFLAPSILAPQFGIWAPVYVGLLTGLGASAGQFLTFLIGYGGRGVSERLTRRFSSNVYDRAVAWMKKRGGWAVFLMSVMANPLHLPMTLAIAALKYPPYLFFIFTFLGVGLKSLVLAFAGYYGMNTLYEWMAGKMSTISLIATLAVIAAVLIGAAIWQLLILRKENRDKSKKYADACAQCASCGKPLLVVGGPWGVRWARRWLNRPAHGSGDVCMDIDVRALQGHHTPVVASVTHIPFADKTFGAVFVSHVLEHLPTTDDAKHALEELNRVAEKVYIVYPSRNSLGGWLTPGHHLWVWQEGTRTFFKQRGRAASREFSVFETASNEP